MKKPEKGPRRKLAVILSGIFLFAMIMGPGPGVSLVNPDSGDAGVTFLGAPVLYAWAVFWFMVQAAVIVVAYCTVWKEERQ